MTTQDFIISLFSQVDDDMIDVPKRSDANLYPSEVVTLALLFALKGVGNRAFYRSQGRDEKDALSFDEAQTLKRRVTSESVSAPSSRRLCSFSTIRWEKNIGVTTAHGG